MWQDEMTLMLRYLISDIEGATYSDLRLQTALVIGARYVNPIFDNKYTIQVSGSTITPDPYTDNDIPFMNLTVLKTACLLSTGEAKISAGQGIAIKDGSSSLDLKGISSAKSEMMKSYCEMYEDAKVQYLSGSDGSSGPPGAAIMSPINVYSWETRGLYGKRRCQDY